MANERIIIEVDLDIDGNVIATATKKVTKQAEKAGDDIGKSLEKGIRGGFNNITSGLTNLRNTIFGLSAVVGAFFVGNSIIEAATRQEDAIEKLNRSLKRIGDFTPEASKSLQEYASSIQSVTRFGDEAVLEQLAFAQSMGASAEQSKKVVSAAVDLASALDIDLNAATRNIAKTLGGFSGELGEVIPELKNLTTAQLRAGEGIELLANKYKGFAENEAPSFSKSLEQAKNATGDLLESIGGLITKTDVGRSALEALGFAADFYKKKLSDASDTQLNLEQVNAEIDSTNEKIAQLQAELVANKDSLFFNSFLGGASRVKKEIDELIVKELELVQVKKSLEAEQQVQADIKTTQRLEKDRQEKEAILQQLKSFGILTLEEINLQEQQRLDAINLAKQNDIISQEEFNNQKLSIEETYQQKRLELINGANKKVVQSTFDANKALGSIVASGTTNFIQTLLKGGNAADAFGDLILSTFGDLATQLGQFYIAAGIAQLKLFALNGGATIAAGVGLVALGQILKSFQSSGIGGGGASASAGVSSAQPSSFSDTATEQIASDSDVQKVGQTINLTVQGNILDRKESGLELINIINETIDSDNVVINQSFA